MMISEKLLSIALIEITETLPYKRVDVSELSEEDSILLCQEVTRNIDEMLQWYETIDETSVTYDIFQSIDSFRVDIEESGLIVTFLGNNLENEGLYHELAVAMGEGVLQPSHDCTFSGKEYAYSFQLL